MIFERIVVNFSLEKSMSLFSFIYNFKDVTVLPHL